MLTIEPRPAALELDGLTVGRILPWVRRRMVGPFIFLDVMGPAELGPGHAMDVRPHPHIGLSTVTYLFDGEIVHRDSLGCTQVIRPGEINWMTAGRGIAHSERTPESARAHGTRLHGLQLWVALPKHEEERAPTFDHFDRDALPESTIGDARVRLLAGTGWGLTSPVPALSPLVYAEVHVPAGALLPWPEEHPELGLYLVSGRFGEWTAGKMHVFDGERPELRADGETHVMLIGGSGFPEKRYIWWNFVSSSRERIEQAKGEWMERKFPVVVGDEEEYVPLPADAWRQSPATGAEHD
ncbi:MAG TPA: pirin family protein [Thermoanaerobaculia bacterium]|nr:pirin family protein [Thermoanaerobaculia bacterium]